MAEQERTTVDANRGDRPPALFGILFYVFIGILFLMFNDGAKQWVVTNKLALGVIAIVTLVVLAVVWFKIGSSTVQSQIGVVIYLVIPLLLAPLLLINFVPDKYEVPILRSVFFLIVTLLPATLYFLFISSRKTSLLQEYLTNLARLGLFDHQPHYAADGKPRNETNVVRKIRVMSYIQKFEAVYGPIPPELAGEIVDATNPEDKSREVPEFHKYSGNIGAIFTLETTIPVIFATLLIGIGWLLALPPWGVEGIDVSRDFSTNAARVLRPELTPVNFAFLGAYFFSIQMLFKRFVRRDLRANAFIAVTMRILIATILVWVVAEIAHVALGTTTGAAVDTTTAAFAELTGDAPANGTVVSAATGEENGDEPADGTEVSAGIGEENGGEPADGTEVSAGTGEEFGDEPADETEVSAGTGEENGDSTSGDTDRRPEPPLLLALGFVIGVFPAIAWQVVQEFFKKVTFSSFFVPSLNSSMPVSELDGLTVWHEARLEEEDIENVPNMATADLVELLLNTRFPPNRVVDWVDQALFYTQLGPEQSTSAAAAAREELPDSDGEQQGGERPAHQTSRREELRKYGIRSASSLIDAFVKAQDQPAAEKFQKILPDDPTSRIRTLVDTLSTNANLRLVQKWNGALRAPEKKTSSKSELKDDKK